MARVAILGYCPCTGVAAIGDGCRDAISGVIGMVVGAAVFAETYPWFNEYLLKPLDLGKETLATITGITPCLSSRFNHNCDRPV